MFYIYTGLRGAGKSYAATKLIIEKLRKKRRVWANYDLDFSRCKIKIPTDKCFFAPSVGDLVDMRGEDFKERKGYKKPGLFVYDESLSELFNRDWLKLPKSTVECYRQSRKIGMDIILISQSFDDLDPTIRRIAEIVREFHSLGSLCWYFDFSTRDVGKEKRKAIGFGMYFRRRWIAEAYDSWQLFGSMLLDRPDRKWRGNGTIERNTNTEPQN